MTSKETTPSPPTTPPEEIPDRELAFEFQQAMLDHNLSLYFQPIIHLKTGLVAGFETLMRWNHPERGFISPGIFIPVAERTGMIVEASKWALKEAIRALKRLESHVGHNEFIYMSVNFSPSDLADESFLDEMYNVISASDVRPTQVQLEITGELLKDQRENAKTILDLCRKTGLKIAIDDYGLGDPDVFFKYMDDFPISTVKIDHLVTKDLLSVKEAEILVNKIISEAKARNIEVIAEGVETKEEALKLRELGCRYGQGYYFTKALPERELTTLLLQISAFNELLK
ncbi:MAG TPA: EAL domain-containing protein [Alphaproteobacteria bacterium]|jgi:EAL domain-containing protein (putative c-di-GMP-specific phosphodiesterase class I)|nr:EAL domain-containing protein [Alphaproteobacteria bacterium]HRK98090.1 EAL domain-containing protein [Alphaproteobacteria bacterium]